MSEVKKIATRDSYGAALVELAKDHPDVVVLDARSSRRSRRASTASRCRYARRTAASTRSRRSSYRRTWRRYVSSRTCSKKATARTSRE